MPKLPPDFVKPPVFDNPIRSTRGATLAVVAEPGPDNTVDVSVRLTLSQWRAIQVAAQASKLTAEAMLAGIVDDWMETGAHAAAAPAPEPAAPPRSAESPRLVDAVVNVAWNRLSRWRERSAAVRRLSAWIPAPARF